MLLSVMEQVVAVHMHLTGLAFQVEVAPMAWLLFGSMHNVSLRFD